MREDQAKDLVKRKRRPEVYLNDATAVDDEVEHVGADEVYADVERVAPTLPADLTDLEQEIILRFYLDATQREVAIALAISRREMERAVRSIRGKLSTVLPERALAA